MKHCNIPIFVAHRGCPFDCVFCNQHHITGDDTCAKGASVTGAEVERIIGESLADTADRYTEAAFFGGSFTGIPVAEQEELLSAAYKFVEAGKITGIRVSTRPDYIDRTILDRLRRFGVKTIELGVQSMDDEVLLKAGRGHTSADVENAVRLIKEYGGFSLGLQMMTGLPDDTAEKSYATGVKIAGLKLDFVRIYPTLTIADTKLYDMYKAGKYTPQTVDEAVSVCVRLLRLFRDNNIEVIRVSLQTTDEICEGGAVMAGPYHPNFGELCMGDMIYEDMRGALAAHRGEDLTLEFDALTVPKAIGYKRRNVIRAENEYNVRLKIKANVNGECKSCY